MTIEQLIYTDVPRGRGLDPALAGFQVAACSSGIDAAERELIGAVCRHYGDAVYRGASDEALDRESAWRAAAESVAGLPDEVLALFPEIWSYDAIGGDRFALTRVRYAGAAHDGRFGNFFAHALVVRAGDLDAEGLGPLALARSGRFLARYSGEGTALPALEGPDAPREKSESALLAEPFRDRLEELLAAACRASSLARPLLVRVADWRAGAPVVAALLDALPPARRCRTTFCTLENDRKWLPPSGPASRQAGAVAAHDVVVLAGRAGGDLRPDEYRTGYAVFNFVDGRFGDGEPGAYALFAGRCLRSGEVGALDRNHAALERLGLGGEPGVWDAMVGVERLPDDGSVASYARALAGAALDPESAGAALDLLAATLEREGAEAVEPVASDLATLAERAGDGAWLAVLRDLASAAVAGGRGRLAGDLFRACGPYREASLVAVLPACAEAVLAHPDRREGDRLADLFFEGADAASGAGDDATFERLVETALGVSTDDAWETAAAPRLGAYLDGAWDARRAAFASRLAVVLAPDAWPEGAAWIGERIVARARPSGRELMDALARLARASSRSAAGRKLAESVLRTARASFSGVERCEALARIASADPSDAFFDAYASEVRGLDEPDAFALRRSLAETGAAAAPVRELLAAALARDDAAFVQWWTELAGPVAGAREELYDQLAAAVAAGGEGALDLALDTLGRTGSEPDANRGRLLDAVVLAVPMEPLSVALGELVAASRDRLGEAAARRVATMELLAGVSSLSTDARWSAGRFLTHFGADEWPRTIRALRQEDKGSALAFCRATFEAQGIQTPEDAEGWVLFMGAAGEATVEEITSSVVHMLNGRDQATCVVAAAAFARCALGASSVEGAWGEILKGLVEAFDKETRRAFERHILLGFNRPDRDYDLRVEALAREAGFTPPSEMGSSSRSGVSLKPPSQKAPTTTTLFGSSKRFFGKK